MTTKIFYLIAGDQTRWKAGEGLEGIPYKQWAPIGDERLIDRIYRQFPGGIKVSHNQDFAPDFEPRDRAFICQTVFSTMPLWNDGDRKLFILCDVVFSDAAAETILKGTDNRVAFYGSKKQGEIFAFDFHHTFNIVPFLLKVENGVKRGEVPGRLWNLYRAVSGITMTDHRYEGGYFVDVEDGQTTDFDTKEEYINYLKGVIK